MICEYAPGMPWQAMTSLPEECKKYGVTVLKRSPSILQVMAFYCDNGRYDDIYVGNYVLLNVVDELKRIACEK